MNQDIINAIKKREQLTFRYDGLQRIVEPHTYGVTTTGKESLRAYQVQRGHVSGHNQPWHLFTISKMVDLHTTGSKFQSARPGYKRQDKAMQQIYAQL